MARLCLGEVKELPDRYDYDDEDEILQDEYEDYGDFDEEDEYLDELPPEEKKMRKIGRFKVAAGLFNFVAVIIGLVVTLVFVSLIFTLVNWVISDLSNTFKFITN